MVVLPELSPTGYELDAGPISCDDPALTPIVDACTAKDSIAPAVAPVQEAGHRFIAMLAVDAPNLDRQSVS